MNVCCRIAGHSTAPKGESQSDGWGMAGGDGRGGERLGEGGKQGEGV